MAYEIECKFCSVDINRVRSLVLKSQATFCSVFFEQNYVFDDENLSLFHTGRLLRLRVNRCEEKVVCFATVKQKSKKHLNEGGHGIRGLKVREEFEVSVSDARTFKNMLEVLGYKEQARYEKVRESYLHSGCHIEIDTLPFGDFVELEGEPKAIESLTQTLGLFEYRKTDASYYDLYEEYCRQKGSISSNPSFVFEKNERKRIEESLHITTCEPFEQVCNGKKNEAGS